MNQRLGAAFLRITSKEVLEPVINSQGNPGIDLATLRRSVTVKEVRNTDLVQSRPPLQIPGQG